MKTSITNIMKRYFSKSYIHTHTNDNNNKSQNTLNTEDYSKVSKDLIFH